MTALHYAHEHYRDDATSGGDAAVGGPDFPGREQPNGMAFLYFPYVIGIAAQVADVAISSTAMRRRVTVHFLFSLFFNRVIVAATVNSSSHWQAAERLRRPADGGLFSA